MHYRNATTPRHGLTPNCTNKPARTNKTKGHGPARQQNAQNCTTRTTAANEVATADSETAFPNRNIGDTQVNCQKRRRRCTCVQAHMRLMPRQRLNQKRSISRDRGTAGRPFNNRSKATSAPFILEKYKTPGPRCAAPLFLGSEKSTAPGGRSTFSSRGRAARPPPPPSLVFRSTQRRRWAVDCSLPLASPVWCLWPPPSARFCAAGQFEKMQPEKGGDRQKRETPGRERPRTDLRGALQAAPLTSLRPTCRQEQQHRCTAGPPSWRAPNLCTSERRAPAPPACAASWSLLCIAKPAPIL